MSKKQILGIVLFIILVLVIIAIGIFKNKDSGINLIGEDLTTVYVATGGGKEAFIADEDVVRIMEDKYHLNVVYDNWSNGKLIVNPLVREDGQTKYDAMFSSDQRFYDYYKLSPNKEAGEADRYRVLDGGLTLNTPIVIYSWGKVVDALEAEEIVTENNRSLLYNKYGQTFRIYFRGKKMV